MWLRAKIEIARLVGSGFDHNIPPYLPNIPQELSREEDGGRTDHLRRLSMQRGAGRHFIPWGVGTETGLGNSPQRDTFLLWATIQTLLESRK